MQHQAGVLIVPARLCLVSPRFNRTLQCHQVWLADSFMQEHPAEHLCRPFGLVLERCGLQ